MKIATVVVTYNRLNLLKQCLKGIIDQTYQSNWLIIVDNASTDGTDAWVQTIKMTNGTNLIYLRQKTNTGGAGGFNFGMTHAMNIGADAIWLMDDDVVPNADCLAALVAELAHGDIVHPTKLCPDGSKYLWHQWLDPVSLWRTPTHIENNSAYRVATNVACFEGALISRKVVTSIGLPDPSFFIGEDDTLYGLLAAQEFTVLYISSAQMHRLLDMAPKVAPWKVYYLTRNMIWLRRRIDTLMCFSGRRRTCAFALLVLQIINIMLSNSTRPKGLLGCIRGIRDGFFTSPSGTVVHPE